MSYSNNEKIIKKLEKITNKWGGKFHKINNKNEISNLYDSNAFSEAPFVSNNIFLGVNFNRKIIYFDSKAQWPQIIHEMGHVFASKKEPNISDEYVFFGWEYCLAKKIRASITDWLKESAEYNIVNDDVYSNGSKVCTPVGELNKYQRSKLFKARIKDAKKHHLLDNKLNPLAIR